MALKQKRLKGKIILVTGGSRSGKSSFAQKLASTLSKEVIFIATAQAKDNEMRRRIALHKKARPRHWATIEAPFEVAKAVSSSDGKCSLILIDCLTLLVSNLLLSKLSEHRIGLEAKRILAALIKSKKDAIVVTNELGMGIVPDKPLARKFRDIHGRVNQLFADCADEVYLVVCGLPVKIK